MRILVLILVLFMSGCTTYAGIGIHAHRFDSPEYTADNPVGMIGGSIRVNDRIDLKFEHHSSVFMAEEGVGYNIALITIKHEWMK